MEPRSACCMRRLKIRSVMLRPSLSTWVQGVMGGSPVTAVATLMVPWTDEERLSLSMHELGLSIFEPMLAMASAMVAAHALVSCEPPPVDGGTLMSQSPLQCCSKL